MPVTLPQIRSAESFTTEIFELKSLVDALGPIVGQFCEQHDHHKDDDEALSILADRYCNTKAAQLLNARAAYAEYLAYNQPEPAETTSDDYEPVENWRPERDI